MQSSGSTARSFANWPKSTFIRHVQNAICQRNDAIYLPGPAAAPLATPPSATASTAATVLEGELALAEKNQTKGIVDETTSWVLETYGLKDLYSVRSKVQRASAALQQYSIDSDGDDTESQSHKIESTTLDGNKPTTDMTKTSLPIKLISLEGDIIPKTEMLDALSPGLGWKVFSRYPEEFVHPYAEDYWKIMAAFLYTIGFEPERISSLFKRHPSLFARTVQDPSNLKDLFDWFQELGLEQDGAVRVINKFPLVLQSSVENTLKPRLAYITEQLGVPMTSAVSAIRRCPEILGVESSHLQERVDYLENDLGLSSKEIAKLFGDQPTVLVSRIEEKLQPVVQVLENELGCSGELLRRMIANSGLLTRTPETIRKRVALWTDLGVGPELLRAALQRFPRLLLYPMDEPKYQKKIQFLREELGLEPIALVSYPQYVSYSLPDRIAPRTAAVKYFKSGDDESTSAIAATKTSSIALHAFSLKEEAFLKSYGIAQDEYNSFIAEWSKSEDAKQWHDD